MSGESINAKSAYTQIIASGAVASGAWSADSSAITAVLTTGNEKLYPLLDFQLLITSEGFTDGDKISLHRIPSDGTNEAVSPDDYTEAPPHFVGAFVAEANSTALYIYGVPNIDENDKFKYKNGSGASFTASLNTRSRTQAPAT